ETGSAFTASQVEAIITPQGSDFAPDVTNAQFAGKAFAIAPAGSLKSSHATGVGMLLYGLTSSFSPGPTSINAYEAGYWLSSVLRTGSGLPPFHDGSHAMNHSWIGAYGGGTAVAAAENAY